MLQPLNAGARHFAFVIVALVAASIAPVTAAGSIVQVKYSGPHDGKLTDLIVYDDAGHQEVILKPNDASDDIPIGVGSNRVFVSTLEVTKYFISQDFGVFGEAESYLFDVTLGEPRTICFLVDPSGLTEVSLGCDDAVAPPDPPAEGSALSAVAGTVFDAGGIEIPGWFAGTAPDFAGGGVGGPYTGPLEIAPDVFEVTVLPPAIPTLRWWGAVLLALALLGIATVMVRRRARGTV